MTWYV